MPTVNSEHNFHAFHIFILILTSQPFLLSLPFSTTTTTTTLLSFHFSTKTYDFAILFELRVTVIALIFI